MTLTTSETFTLSLHDALPIYVGELKLKKELVILGIETSCDETAAAVVRNGTEILSNVVTSQIDIHKPFGGVVPEIDRKSTRLNSSHVAISYAVFCLKKKNKKK